MNQTKLLLPSLPWLYFSHLHPSLQSSLVSGYTSSLYLFNSSFVEPTFTMCLPSVGHYWIRPCGVTRNKTLPTGRHREEGRACCKGLGAFVQFRGSRGGSPGLRCLCWDPWPLLVCVLCPDVATSQRHTAPFPSKPPSLRWSSLSAFKTITLLL